MSKSEKRAGMERRAFLIALASVFCAFVLAFPLVTPARATFPTLVQSKEGTNAGSSTSWATTFTSNTAVGDVLVATVIVRNCCTGAGNTNPVVTSITDSQTNTWVMQVQSTGYLGDGSNSWDAEVWSTTATGATTDAVTVHVNVGPTQSSSDYAVIYDVQAISATAITASHLSAITASTTWTTDTSIGTGGFEVATAVSAGGGTPNPSAGFIAGPAGAGSSLSMYSLTITSPTNFAMTVASSNTWTEVGATFTPTGGTVGAYTVGQCPTKNTATTTLVNNTEYFYTSTAESGATINTVSTFVAQVTSATAPQTLTFGIYATQNAGGVSAGNTFFLIAAFSKSLTAGTTNNAINWSPGVGLSGTLIGNIPTGATIGIALLGTNKIKINQSSLAGMTTGSTSGGVLASTFTSLSASVNQLYLCMNLTFQAVITSTTTVTSTTTTSTATTITTAGGGSTPSSFITNPQTPVLFLVLLMPTIVLLFISKNVVGALVGLGIGAVIAVSAGVLDRFLFFAIIIGIVAAAFLARNRDD